MASSSYYYNLYKQKKNAVKSYDDDIDDLRKALSNLTDTMNDEIRAVNNELEDLKADLNKSIRHNSKFTSRANAVTSEKEKAVTADPNLSVAVRELEEEISRLNGLRTTAINDREYYYQKYKGKKKKNVESFLTKSFRKEKKNEYSFNFI